jgi:hypothetical protein
MEALINWIFSWGQGELARRLEYGFNAVIAEKVMRHTDFYQRFPGIAQSVQAWNNWPAR